MIAGVLSGLIAAVAVTALAANYIMTIRRYAALPDSVPYHFDAYGNPDQFASRPVIFISPIALTIAFGVLMLALANGISDSLGGLCGLGAIVDFVLISGYYLQRGILNVALGKVQTMHPYAFWRN